MIKNEKNMKQQNTLSLTITALFSFAPIVFFVNILTNKFINENIVYDTILLYLILLFLIFRSLTFVINKIKIDVLIITILFIVTYLFNYLFFEQNREFMFTNLLDIINNPFYNFIVYNLFGYIFMRYIYDFDIFDGYLLKFSYIIVIVSFLSYIILLDTNEHPQYMVFSYNMLFHTIYLFINFIEKKSVFSGIISTIGVILIFVSGARGPIVIFIFTILLYSLLRKEKFEKKIINLCSVSILTIFVYFNFNIILKYILNEVQRIGINSRTLQIILSNDFLNTSGRDLIFFEQIKKVNFFGFGLFGDRVISNTYSHNLLLEFLVQHGYFIGSILFLLLFGIIISGFVSNNNKINRLTLIFISTGFLKLFLSGSYLNQEPSLYILLGLCINSYCEGREIRNEINMVD